MRPLSPAALREDRSPPASSTSAPTQRAGVDSLVRPCVRLSCSESETMSTGQSFETAARQAGSQLRQLQSSMPSFVELAVFLVFSAASIGLAIYVGQTNVGLGISIGVAG